MKIDTGIKLSDVEQLANAIEANSGQSFDGLREALTAGTKGEFSNSQIITPEQMLVKQARARLKLSQKDFAAKIKTLIGTLRDWEQGRTKPNGATGGYTTPQSIVRGIPVSRSHRNIAITN